MKHGGYESENAERAGRMEGLMMGMRQRNGADRDPETNVCDLLTDLMHYCDVYGVDFDGRLDMARVHYNEEITEDAE